MMSCCAVPAGISIIPKPRGWPSRSRTGCATHLGGPQRPGTQSSNTIRKWATLVDSFILLVSLAIAIQKGTGANRGNGGFQRPQFAPNAFLNPHYSVNARALGRIRFGSVFMPLFSRLSLVQLHCFGLVAPYL